MAIIEIVILTGLGIVLGAFIVNMLNNRQQQRILDDAFYKLLQLQNGKVSLIQLAAAAKVDAQVAQRYLENQVQIFSAILEIDEQGDTFYKFPNLSLPPVLDQQPW
ncbi:hypothetical protein Tery_1311 [Trichodesmium erythraeum IMS101]|uniref:Uncharacterized protein n=1 Tax=Trichodesmium erythraeum (strain IMS101) TaxID=203124 RepID=Q116D8_TRIEI|nr:hypothetical protein [Trichodesmium erythraeum GBRTRLIN201]MCH2047996.1 hypothetical protein [Trichodesmium sp. ALOHA_ZT_67]MCL2928766.1 hypothetical protein [Trichodesmium sp. MAG_R01]MDE5093569.1 hypothetical protein [Trichodesmium sp. St11_bin5]MDT9342173.1 hypothetical protein [Trichodesmium erythraeum 21-75]